VGGCATSPLRCGNEATREDGEYQYLAVDEQGLTAEHTQGLNGDCTLGSPPIVSPDLQ